MLTLNEQERLKKLLELLKEEETPQKKLDVSERLRDRQGRFLPNESQLKSKEEFPLRSIKLVKVKGTYGTYAVKQRWIDEDAIRVLVTLGTVVALVIIL